MYCEHFIQKNFLNQLKTDRNHLNLESFYPISIFDELSWLLIYHGWIVPVLSASFHSTNCPPPPPVQIICRLKAKPFQKYTTFIGSNVPDLRNDRKMAANSVKNDKLVTIHCVYAKAMWNLDHMMLLWAKI